MRTDLPVCKRCCFCLPLRYGLLSWGYFKLITTTVVTIALAVTLVNVVSLQLRYGTSPRFNGVGVLSIFLIMLLIEIVLNIVFVIGGHKKNVKLLRIYYIYNAILWGLSIVLFVILICLVLPKYISERIWSYQAYLFLIDFSTYFFNIVTQSYFLLLLRSEILKLKNNCQFEFTNNAAEAQCTMKYKEQLLDEEMGTADDSGTDTWKKGDVCQKTCPSNGTCQHSEDQG